MKPWWNKKYGKDSICSITKTRLRPGKNNKGESYTIFLRCGHGYCRTALKKLVETSLGKELLCPLCRKGFDPELKFK